MKGVKLTFVIERAQSVEKFAGHCLWNCFKFINDQHKLSGFCLKFCEKKLESECVGDGYADCDSFNDQW